MAKPEFAPGVTIEVVRVGEAGETVARERVEIPARNERDAENAYEEITETTQQIKRDWRIPLPFVRSVVTD